ncbi:hypothetical protein DFP80_1019 [Marinomonas rhizomae]|uniref:Uncharacterized protein n=1 Tax=Marinomonas rhizomae TaxID=491948 RepID=A0A366JEV6_9GAMM|nr:hypothetical protein DFP80_1019 [Marinomonas rhizomae]
MLQCLATKQFYGVGLVECFINPVEGVVLME